MHLSLSHANPGPITNPSPPHSCDSSTLTTHSSSSLSLFSFCDLDDDHDESTYKYDPASSTSTMLSALSPVSLQSPSSMIKEHTQNTTPGASATNPGPSQGPAKSDDPFDVDNYPTDFDSAFLNLSPTMGMDDGLDGIPLFNAEEESAFSSFLDNIALDPNFIFEPNLSDTLPKWPATAPHHETQKPQNTDKFTKFGNSPGLDLLAAHSPDAANIHERLLKHESKEYMSPSHNDYVTQTDSRAQALAMAETQGYSLKHKEAAQMQSVARAHTGGPSQAQTAPSAGQGARGAPLGAAARAPIGLHFGSDPAFGGPGFQPSMGTPALKKARGFEEMPAVVHEDHSHIHLQPQRIATGLEGVVNPKLVVAAQQIGQVDLLAQKRRKSDNPSVPHDIYAPIPHVEQMYVQQQQQLKSQHNQIPQQQLHLQNQLQKQHFQPRMGFGDVDGDIPMGMGMHMNPNPSMLFPDKDALSDSFQPNQVQHQQQMHLQHQQQQQQQQHLQQQQQQHLQQQHYHEPQPTVKTEQNLSTSPQPQPGSPILTEDQKRMNHISSEKRRRDLIKQEFEEMCGLVPRLAGTGDEKGKRRHGHRGRMPKDSDKDKDTGTKSKSILLSIVYDYMCELIERNKTMRSLITEKGGFHSDIPNALHPPKIDE